MRLPTGQYRAPLPLTPRRNKRKKIRNFTDTHDSGYAVTPQLVAHRLFTAQGVPTVHFFLNPQAVNRIDAGMNVFTPKVRAQIDMSSASERDALYREYHWFDPRITYTIVHEAVQAILEKTFTETVREGEEWINQYVPKATGQLRESLKKQLHARTNLPGGIKLLLTIGSYVKYLPYVATMSPTRYRLQHAPPERRFVNYYGAPRWVILDDPSAKHYFFWQLITYLRQVLREKLARAIMQVSNRLNVPQYFFRMRMRTDDK